MSFLAIALALSGPLDRCLDQGDAAKGVDPAMAACYAADYQRADTQLNTAYRATMRRLAPPRQTALRTSQRAWIQQRDAACPLDDSPGAGTIERLNHPACLAKQTRLRTAWLLRFR